MKLEEQVVSLELSKKLKELGIKQESLWWWTGRHLIKPREDVIIKLEDSKLDKKFWENHSRWRLDFNYSAFTVAELGEKLPMELKNRNGKYDGKYFETTKISGSWMIEYRQGKKLIVHEMMKTEADCRAKMLIYLIENKLI